MHKKEDIKCNDIKKKNTKTINLYGATKENIKEHNPNWPQISHHPYKISVTGGSESGKSNTLLNLINHKLYIGKIY